MTWRQRLVSIDRPFQTFIRKPSVDLFFDRVPLPSFPQVALAGRINRRVEKEREDRRRRPIDRHRHTRRRRHEVKARVEPLRVVECRDRDPGVADLAEDVRLYRRVRAIERDRIKGRRQTRRGLALAH